MNLRVDSSWKNGIRTLSCKTLPKILQATLSKLPAYTPSDPVYSALKTYGFDHYHAKPAASHFMEECLERTEVLLTQEKKTIASFSHFALEMPFEQNLRASVNNVPFNVIIQEEPKELYITCDRVEPESQPLNSPALVIVHADPYYDEKMVSKEPIQKLINSNAYDTIYEFMHNSSMIEHHGFRLWNRGGEYYIPGLFGNDFTFVGGNVKECLYGAFSSIIVQSIEENHFLPVRIHFPMDAMFTSEEDRTNNYPAILSDFDKHINFLTRFQDKFGIPTWEILGPNVHPLFQQKHQVNIKIWQTCKQMLEFLKPNK